MEVKDGDVLIVVDVQNDFCPGGALPVPDGHHVVRPINSIMQKFDRIVFSRDWHPHDHCSFSDEPKFEDKSWPEHCVEDTPGAEFHGDLMVPSDSLVINKGTHRDKEAYSAFQGEIPLKETLEKWGAKRLFVGGLAADVCVKFTTLDARKAGFETYVLADATRGISEESAKEALDEMREAGATTITTGELE